MTKEQGTQKHGAKAQGAQAQWAKLTGQSIAEYVAGELLNASESSAVFRIAAPAEHAEAGSCLVLRESPDQAACEARRNRVLEAMFLEHPNLLRVFDSGCHLHGGQWLHFAVTEPLGEALAGASAEEIAGWVPGIAAGLEYLHSNHLVYIALSATSVWRAAGEWKLGDFSELRAEGNYSPQDTRRLMIRPELSVPPEAWEGVVSPCWDAWSLGNVLHVLGSDAKYVGELMDPDPSQRLSIGQFNRRLVSGAPAAVPPAMPESVRGQTPVAPEPPPGTASFPAATARQPGPIPVSSRSDLIYANATRVRQRSRMVVWASLLLGLLVLLLLAVAVWGKGRSGQRASAGQVPASFPGTSRASGDAPISAPPAQFSGAPTREDAKQQIQALLQRWANSIANRDVNEQLECYAPVVARYFGGRNLSREDLRRAKQEAFGTIGTVRTFRVNEVVLKQLTDDRAVVSIQKQWDFPERRFSGRERDEMELRRIDGEWKIASEQESRGSRETQIGG